MTRDRSFCRREKTDIIYTVKEEFLQKVCGDMELKDNVNIPLHVLSREMRITAHSQPASEFHHSKSGIIIVTAQ